MFIDMLWSLELVQSVQFSIIAADSAYDAELLRKEPAKRAMSLCSFFIHKIIGKIMLKNLRIVLLFAICMNVVPHQLSCLQRSSDAGSLLEYCKELVAAGHAQEKVLELINASLQEVSESGLVRGYYPKVHSKKREKVISFAVGVSAGLALVAGGLGVFYLYASSKDAKDKKENTDTQIHPPNNFHQKNNWCWMVSVIQGLYNLDTFKTWVKQKASENDSELISPLEKDKIALAGLLDNCFEAMAACAKSNNAEDMQKQVECAGAIYEKLFDIKGRHENHENIAPEKRYAFHSGSKFCSELLKFFGKDEAGFPFGVEGLSDPAWGNVIEKKSFYFQQCDNCGTAQNIVLNFFDQGRREKRSFKDEEELIKLRNIKTNQILCFGMEAVGKAYSVSQTISVAEKEYDLKAIVMCGQQHMIAGARHDKWYIFDSMKKQRVALQDAQMKKIYAGKGYGCYKPHVLFYQQK